jgi:hypothetical protein
MITSTQQSVINSITSNFESLNSKFADTSPNALARKIMEEIKSFDDEVSDFKAMTEAYEIANNALFADLCSQVKELTDSLGLKFTYDNGFFLYERYTNIREFKIIFPQFKDNTVSNGEVSISFYVKSILASINNISGLSRSGFVYELQYKNYIHVNDNNIFDVISNQIINTFKIYKK